MVGSITETRLPEQQTITYKVTAPHRILRSQAQEDRLAALIREDRYEQTVRELDAYLAECPSIERLHMLREIVARLPDMPLGNQAESVVVCARVLPRLDPDERVEIVNKLLTTLHSIHTRLLAFGIFFLRHELTRESYTLHDRVSAAIILGHDLSPLSDDMFVDAIAFITALLDDPALEIEAASDLSIALAETIAAPATAGRFGKTLVYTILRRLENEFETRPLGPAYGTILVTLAEGFHRWNTNAEALFSFITTELPKRSLSAEDRGALAVALARNSAPLPYEIGVELWHVACDVLSAADIPTLARTQAAIALARRIGRLPKSWVRPALQQIDEFLLATPESVDRTEILGAVARNIATATRHADKGIVRTFVSQRLMQHHA